MEIQELYRLYIQHPEITIDSRRVPSDSLFFALKGDNFNGNVFAKGALQQGASFAIVDELEYALDEQYIYVGSVLETLQNLAAYHRKQLSIPVIGVTGTNGKTTTKELLCAVLSQQFNTFATEGNLNNHIGVPLSLLCITADTEVAIIEMGANHVGEIGFLSTLAQPTHGLITNVGRAHLEGFGSFEGVKRAKAELYEYLSVHQGVVFAQGDNINLQEMLSERAYGKVMLYGHSSRNDVVGMLENTSPLLSFSWRVGGGAPRVLCTQLTGSYNLDNFLAAISVGVYFGLAPEKIDAGLSEYRPSNNRSQLLQTERNSIIGDYYNANASSMSAALDNMAVMQASDKVVVLGDMFEMGAESASEHQKVIDKARTLTVSRRIFVGSHFWELRDGEDEFYQTIEQVSESLSTHVISGATVLLKASRGMQFERLLKAL